MFLTEIIINNKINNNSNIKCLCNNNNKIIIKINLGLQILLLEICKKAEMNLEKNNNLKLNNNLKKLVDLPVFLNKILVIYL